MLPIRPSLPENLTIAAVVERLAAAEAVAGVILLGSGGNNSLTSSSDWKITDLEKGLAFWEQLLGI